MFGIKENPVTKAAKMAVEPETAMQEEIDTLKTKYDALLPVESAARLRLEAEIATKKDRLNNQGVTGYKTISTEVLKWRNKRGLPLLAVFRVSKSHAKMMFRAERFYSSQSEQVTPTELDAFWADVMPTLQRRNRRRSLDHSQAECKFEGTIPETARAKIAEAKPIFGDSIFLVQEADWKNTQRKTPRPPLLDPLILGFKNNQLWLIDQFDLTPIEKYIIAEMP